MKTAIMVAIAGGAMLAGPAFAGDYTEYPAPTPGYPFQRSTLTRERLLIPPYRHVFRVRIYATPQQQPYYNVPPYPVISPY